MHSLSQQLGPVACATLSRSRAKRADRLHDLPNLFVVGAAKAGTTAVHHYFKLHPQVFVPAAVKETNYMAFYHGLPPLAGPRDRRCVGSSITTLADYQSLYRGRRGEWAAADVSPAYLYYPRAAYKIHALAPAAKIVIILRNPVECAFSMYSMMRRDGREPCQTFWEAFERSEARINSGWEWAWDYRGCYRFAAQVARYLELFPASQLFIRRYEELQHNPTRFYSDLTGFIGISKIDMSHANRRLNTSPRRIDMLRKRRVGRWLCAAGRLSGSLAPPALRDRLRHHLEQPAFTLDFEDRRQLVHHFRDDVEELSSLLGWDLSDWLQV